MNIYNLKLPLQKKYVLYTYPVHIVTLKFCKLNELILS